MKPRAIVVGPIPPPYHGCSVATAALVSSAITDVFEVEHLDTSDRRSLDNLGTWDLRNIQLALSTIGKAAWGCITRRPRIVYIPISQNGAGFLRDALLIWCGWGLARARILVHLHGGRFREFVGKSSWVMRLIVASTMRRVGVGVVLGEGLRSELEPWIPANRILAIPNGTESTTGRGRNGTRGGEVIVLFLGNLLRFKGVVDVVRAAASIVNRHTNVRFTFAGRWTRDPMFGQSGEEIRSQCESMVHASRRPEAFEFRGEIDRPSVRAALQTADILVLPSYDEGLPLVILEAMSAGIPVVSCRGVGAIEDVVIDGETGMLISPGDQPGLEAALERLITDPEMRTRMGLAGAARWRANYTVERWASEMRKAFEIAAES